MPLTIESIKRVIQEVVVPELREIKIEIKRLDEKIDSLRTEMHDKFDTALEIRERLAALESKVASLSVFRDRNR